MKLIDNIKVRKRLKMQGKTNLVESINHALDGIDYTVVHERNFKIEIFIGIIVLITAYFFEITKIELLILLLTISSVLTLELINTSIERCVDLVTKDYQELAKNAKDIAAGAVFVMSIFSIFIGIIIFLPKILEMIGVN